MCTPNRQVLSLYCELFTENNRTLKAFSSVWYAASTRSKQSQKNASRLSKLGYAAFLLLLSSTRRASNTLFATMTGQEGGYVNGTVPTAE